MIKDILVCLEGSPSTESATRLSIDIARARGAALVGIAIVDEPDIRAGTAVSIGGSSFKRERDEALVADAHKQAESWVALFERRCREAGVPARTIEVAGRPAGSILDEMEARDLVVMGVGANFRFETDADDSETRDAVLHRAVRPVILVPESATTLGPTALVAFDGSGAAKRAMESFAASGLAEGRKVHVATVDDNGEQAWVMANRGVEILRASGIVATPQNVVSPLHTVDALIQLSREIGADFMVMGAYARSRLAALFAGSVTRALVEKTSIPLYLQH